MLDEVDPTGVISSSRKFDVYGTVRGGVNPNGTSKHKFGVGLAHPSDDETGLIYMRARYYDVTIGRFASQDPAHQRGNWFVYASDDPVNRDDRSGKLDGAATELEQEVDWAQACLAAGSFLLTLLVGEVIMYAIELDYNLVSEMRKSREEDKWHRVAKQGGLVAYRQAVRDWIENGQEGPKPKLRYPLSWDKLEREAFEPPEVSDGDGTNDE